MTTGKGLFWGLALIAAAIVIVSLSGRTEAETMRFQIASGGQSQAWAIDTMTGAVKYCLVPGGAPVCVAVKP